MHSANDQLIFVCLCAIVPRRYQRQRLGMQSQHRPEAPPTRRNHPRPVMVVVVVMVAVIVVVVVMVAVVVVAVRGRCRGSGRGRSGCGRIRACNICECMQTTVTSKFMCHQLIDTYLGSSHSHFMVWGSPHTMKWIGKE